MREVETCSTRSRGRSRSATGAVGEAPNGGTTAATASWIEQRGPEEQPVTWEEEGNRAQDVSFRKPVNAADGPGKCQWTGVGSYCGSDRHPLT